MKAYLKIEMPTSCYYCPMTNDGYYLCKATSPFKELEDDCEECKPQWCPLLPVPEHGRLVDADRLLSERMKRMYYHLANGDTAIPIIDVEHAPTIIPANEEGE